ncbi:trypsin-like peptidase domain-containing protein [Natronosporangium hydrolyticum]|uniref:Trypsin-like peptidase domain-containing protein n=1 Tax=Natronosporangium hydrolyticum TaxID=2811111 RepID=A0A895YI35_9ACTN|nr:trypsin-like peptidase domain-containing protein [Natronosporangium hydrolyticum]QSB15712.1 trypsin-like peptidase domain-containing protein [Natronosporangium hydrolyticum]
MSDDRDWHWQRPTEPWGEPAGPAPATGDGPTLSAAYPDPWAAPSGEASSWPGPVRQDPGRSMTSIVLIGALMVISAVGGGIAGAALYSQALEGRGTAPESVRVVDGPQLDYSSLAGIASDVQPSVVSIQVGRFGGSGVIMSEDGVILTNAHVVEPSPDGQVQVRFSNGETGEATVVGADRRSDIAVVQVSDASGLTPARFGESDDVLVGDTVLALGSPLGYEGSVTQGIVSALDRTLRPEDPDAPTLSGLVQTDAAINRGNSGGALVNLAGEVVGINTAIAVEDRQGGFIGLGFAVPSNRATDVAERLLQGEEVRHAFLGVAVGPAEDGGAVIGDVTPGSPADAAGLEPGDVVIRIGDRAITDDGDLVSAVQAAEVDEPIELEYRRGGTTQTITVVLTEVDD